jgi:hypothetical protein
VRSFLNFFAPSLPSPEALYYIEELLCFMSMCVCVSIVEKIAGYVNMGNEGEMLASIACSPFDLIYLLEKHFINELNELVEIPIVY